MIKKYFLFRTHCLNFLCLRCLIIQCVSQLDHSKVRRNIGFLTDEHFNAKKRFRKIGIIKMNIIKTTYPRRSLKGYKNKISIFLYPRGIHRGYMPPEDHKTQKKIQCWIPLETWDKIVSLGYTSPTIAVTKAFEKLLEESIEDPLIDPSTSPKSPIISPEIPGISPEGYKRDIEGYKENIKSLNSEIERLKNVIQEAPDPLELARLQERNEGLNLVIAEKEKRIEDLTREVTTLNGFAHYFKNIEVKQIEAPAAQKSKPWWKLW